MRFFVLPAAVLLLLQSAAFGQSGTDDRHVTIRTQADVYSKRQQLIDYIWGGDGMPARRMPELPVLKNDISPVPGLADLERVDTLMVKMEANVTSYAHHFIPPVKNGRLVILHLGHIPSFHDSGIPADEGFGMRRTLEGLLGDGYSVLGVYMPLNAEFTTKIEVHDDGGFEAHNELFDDPTRHPKKGSPIKYFLEPIAIYLNYLTSRSYQDDFPLYSEFGMVGFSGGGWTTTVYSAIDERIRLSVSVAGSIPLYLRVGAEIGDREQTDPGLYSIAGYPDLYVMGANGPGRKQVHILNRYDWCCFSELYHDPEMAGGLSFDEAIREYEGRVRDALIELGNTDLFSIEVDEAAPGHNVTWDAIYDTILPELNDGKRYIGTATGEEAVARGAGGNPAIFLNGIWSPAKLSPMIGTPAILRGSINIHDMFYRTTTNQLVYVSRPPLIWSRARILAEDVISDPAAASRAPGTFDVVVLASDYFFYHIHKNGGQTHVERVSSSVKGLGQPTLIASENEVLDLFFRSWNRRLYHARKVGSSPWTVEDVGGRMVDFPTAIRLPDGSYRAYVRGLNGSLWEAKRSSGRGGTWGSWSSLSWTLSDAEISGSPSAAIVNGVIEVYARAEGSGIRRFTFDKSWSVSSQPGDYVGSPTASSGGVFIRAISGTLAYSAGDEFTEVGGILD